MMASEGSVDCSDVMAAAADRVLARLDSRHRQRQQTVPPSSTVDQSSSEFWSAVEKLQSELHRHLQQLSEGSEQQCLSEGFDAAGDCLQQLRQLISDWAHRLPAFQLRRVQQLQQQLQLVIQEKRQLLAPRKKFGFKSRRPATAAKKAADDGQCVRDGCEPTERSSTHEFGVRDLSDQTVLINRQDLAGRQVLLSNLTRCRVLVAGTARSLHLTQCVDCQLLIGPTAGPFMMYECTRCDIVVACRQLRVHNSSEIRLHILTSSAPVIEHCLQMTFSAFPASLLPGAAAGWSSEQWRLADLVAQQSDTWRHVHDFNWLSPNQPSPNWRCVEASQSEDWWRPLLDKISQDRDVTEWSQVFC